MKINAKAKINLSLNITGINGGYHELESVVTTVSLSDEIWATKSDKNSVEYKNFSIAPEKDNVYKALELLTRKFGKHLKVKVKKRIPERAGVGGSSALVAGVLRAYKKIYAITDESALTDIAVSVGSDVLSQYTGGYLVMLGRGERVQPISASKKLYFAIVVAQGGVDTAQCFKLYDNSPNADKTDNDSIIRYLKGQGGKLVVGNDLYLPATKINANVKGVYDYLKQSYSLVNMSGSGSAVYAVFDNSGQAKRAVRLLKAKYKKVYYCHNA